MIHPFLNIKTTGFRLFEWLRVIFKYYKRDPQFLKIDLLLATRYLFRNPHQISKAFLKKMGATHIYQFGETPLTTLDRIAKECQIMKHDYVYELGCGSGRTCFWLGTFVGCQVVGIDYLPAFIQKAMWVKRKGRIASTHFLEEDMLKVDLTKASVIYLYGTCLEDEMIKKLIQRFSLLKPKTKVISVSYPLTDYCEGLFEVIKSFEARYPWGKAEVFLQERI